MQSKNNQHPIDPEVLKSTGQPYPPTFWLSVITLLGSVIVQSLSFFSDHFPDSLDSIKSLFTLLNPTELVGYLFMSVVGVFGFYMGILAWTGSGKRMALLVMGLNLLTVIWVLLAYLA